MVALKVQGNAVNATREIQADSEKCWFEVHHSSPSLWKQYIWPARTRDNDRARVCDVTVERQQVQGTKHHLEMESYRYSEEKRTTLPIFVKFLGRSCCQICRPCSKSVGHTVPSTVEVLLKRPNTQKLLPVTGRRSIPLWIPMCKLLSHFAYGFSEPHGKGYTYISAVSNRELLSLQLGCSSSV